MSTADQTPSIKQTPMALVLDAILAIRQDIQKLGEASIEVRESLDRIECQNAMILEAIQTLADGVLEHRARCATMHPPDRELRVAL